MKSFSREVTKWVFICARGNRRWTAQKRPRYSAHNAREPKPAVSLSCTKITTHSADGRVVDSCSFSFLFICWCCKCLRLKWILWNLFHLWFKLFKWINCVSCKLIHVWASGWWYGLIRGYKIREGSNYGCSIM